MIENLFKIQGKLLVLMLLSASTVVSQSDKGSFVFHGRVQKQDKIKKSDITVPLATVTLFKGEKKTSIKTDKNGEFEFRDLEYGYIYKVVLKAPTCIEMFLLIDANIPEKKTEFNYGFQSNFIMFDINDKTINSKKFKYPFMKVNFNGKDLVDDKKYTEDFNNNIIPEMAADEQKALAEQKLLADNQAKQQSALKEKQKKEEEEKAKKYIKIAGKLLWGENPSKPIINTKVMLVNDKEEVVQTATTNFMGSFVFNVFLAGHNYTIKVDESNNQVKPDVKVTFTGKNDKEVQFTKADGKGKFAFKVLASDASSISLITMEDTELKLDLKGKMLSWNDGVKKPLANIKINLVGRTLEIIQSTKTDKDGGFTFQYLTVNQNYTLSVDDGDPRLAGMQKILMTDESGNVIKESVPSKEQEDFKFELLPHDVAKMGKIYVDDPWLQIMEPKGNSSADLIIPESVSFNVNDEKLLPDAQKTLDKVISIMNNVPGISVELSSHTDSQGADDYNMKLSERRAKAAVSYMVSQGTSAARVTAKGYGETRLRNNCGNGIKCTEEEHAKNRRLEFKVIKK